MAHTDTWESFAAKLHNSPNGRAHGSFTEAMGRIDDIAGAYIRSLQGDLQNAVSNEALAQLRSES